MTSRSPRMSSLASSLPSGPINGGSVPDPGHRSRYVDRGPNLLDCKEHFRNLLAAQMAERDQLNLPFSLTGKSPSPEGVQTVFKECAVHQGLFEPLMLIQVSSWCLGYPVADSPP